MKKFSKRMTGFVSLVVALLMSFVLVACGEKKSTNSNTNNVTPEPEQQEEFVDEYGFFDENGEFQGTSLETVGQADDIAFENGDVKLFRVKVVIDTRYTLKFNKFGENAEFYAILSGQTSFTDCATIASMELESVGNAYYCFKGIETEDGYIYIRVVAVGETTTASMNLSIYKGQALTVGVTSDAIDYANGDVGIYSFNVENGKQYKYIVSGLNESWLYIYFEGADVPGPVFSDEHPFVATKNGTVYIVYRSGAANNGTTITIEEIV